GNLAPLVTVWVQGSSTFGHATLTTAAGASNAGIIHLQSIDDVYSCQLNVGSTTLVNTATGKITAAQGRGGARRVNGHQANPGQITVAADTTLTLSGTYNAAGGAITGPGYVVNAQVQVTAAPAAPTTVVLLGNCTLTTNNLANTTLLVQGSDAFGQ